MATTVNIHEAKTHLSKLVDRAERGEKIIIARAGEPAAMLVPLKVEKPQTRRLGFLQGLGYTVPDDIKTPFKEDIEEMFYGNPDKFRSL